MRAIEISGLAKAYGRLRAVDGLDLDIDKGEVFGLIGPNGCGKTTTVKIVCGLLRPDTGTLRVLGSPFKERSHLKRMGYMPQETALYEELTVHENLKLFGGIYGLKGADLKAREKEVLSMVGLWERRGSLLSELSGGQRHRVSLAASMVHSPELLLLDEPTVGVDPPLRARFWDMFRSQREAGRTILMTTHYMDEASRCDRVGMMRDGRLIALGRPGEIIDRTGTKNLEDAFLSLTREVGP